MHGDLAEEEGGAQGMCVSQDTRGVRGEGRHVLGFDKPSLGLGLLF